jgi:hypothetical protein
MRAFLLALGLLGACPLTVVAQLAKPRPGIPIAGARTVVAAVVEAADKNAARAISLRGDELTNYYVRAAAGAARKLPEAERAGAFLLGIGIALDTATLLRKAPGTGELWKKVESDKERMRRLKVIGQPTMHGRHDLTQHFVVSTALTVSHGARKAELAGILKELLDAAGTSGFSFADLAADLSGIAFAEQVLRSPAGLAGLEKAFTVSAYSLPPKGLVEGLSSAEFERRFGSVSDKRFRAELEALRKRVRALPGHKAAGEGK